MDDNIEWLVNINSITYIHESYIIFAFKANEFKKLLLKGLGQRKFANTTLKKKVSGDQN